MGHGAVRNRTLPPHASDWFARTESTRERFSRTVGLRAVGHRPDPTPSVDDYLGIRTVRATDDYGRKPLITSQHGRPAGDTIYKWVNKLTQPCVLNGCPHDADPSDPSTCEALGSRAAHSKCPSSRSPHGLRRGSMTYHLNSDVSPEIVSERCDDGRSAVRDYDVRTNQEQSRFERSNWSESNMTITKHNPPLSCKFQTTTRRVHTRFSSCRM